MSDRYYGMEHPTCKGCKRNAFPICNGSLFGTEKKRIDKMRPSFECGLKNEAEPYQHKLIAPKTPDQIRIDDLEARILVLEER